MKLILYFLCCVLQPICLPIPEMVTVLWGTKQIGSVLAFVTGVTGTVLGIGVMYHLSGQVSGWILKKFHYENGIAKFQCYVRKYGFFIIGVLFIVPILPDEVISVGAALLKVKFSQFIFIAAMSKLISIGMITFSEQMGRVCSLHQWQVILIELILLLMAAKKIQGKERGVA